MGTINLHTSLLPNYRGAAPINRVLINGEDKTGITTFNIDEKIDCGKILLQEEVKLTQNTTAAELHNILMNKGFITTLRVTRGDAIDGACGQLVGKLTRSVKGKKLIKHQSISWLII